jgi:hypothetical protein
MSASERSCDSRLGEVVGASSDATRRGSNMPPAAPVVDRRERLREGLSATSWHAGMDDPALVVMLDEEGVERNQQLRHGECVPTAPDLDLDRRHPLVLI